MTGFSFRNRDMISSSVLTGSFSKVCGKSQTDSLHHLVGQFSRVKEKRRATSANAREIILATMSASV
jgi:hypothetical protein